MADKFDPYHEWLGIPASEQPPNHYRLLSIPAFEASSSVIENAADQRMAHLRTFQTGKHSRESQRLLNEVAAARVCLLNVEKKAAYDKELRQAFQKQRVQPAPPPLPAGGRPVPRARPWRSSRQGGGKGLAKRAAAENPWRRRAPLLGGVLLAAVVLLSLLVVAIWSSVQSGPTTVVQRHEPAGAPERKKVRPPNRRSRS